MRLDPGTLPEHETLDPSSIESLRNSSRASRKAGETAWIRLDGLSVEDGTTHAALCHTLTRFRLGADTGRPVPKIVVLDWSTVENCSAEGLAFFAVLATRLLADGLRVIACEPSVGAIAQVIRQSGVHAACQPLTWIPCTCDKSRTVESLAPIATFSSESNETIDLFCETLSEGLKQVGLSRKQAAMVMGTMQELLHNVLSHANAAHGVAASLLFPKKRPKVVQIGIADDGAGIPETVLRQGRHEWLQWFHDASVTEVVLSQALSSRDKTTESGNGGG